MGIHPGHYGRIGSGPEELTGKLRKGYLVADVGVAITWKPGDVCFWNEREAIINNVSTRKKTAFIRFENDGSSHNKPLSELRPPRGIGGVAEVHNHFDSPYQSQNRIDADRRIVDQRSQLSRGQGPKGPGSGTVEERGTMDKGEGETQDDRDDDVRSIQRSSPIPDIEQRSGELEPTRHHRWTPKLLETVACQFECGRTGPRFTINRHHPWCGENPNRRITRSRSGPTTTIDPPSTEPELGFVPDPSTDRMIVVAPFGNPHEHPPGLSVCFQCMYEASLEVIRNINFNPTIKENKSD